MKTARNIALVSLVGISLALAAWAVPTPWRMPRAGEFNGSSDTVQLKVKGFSTQTSLPFVVENSAGTDLFTVSNLGAVTSLLGYTPTGGVAAAGGFSASPRLCASLGEPATVAGDGNNSTPSVTETYWSEVFVPCNMTITGIAVFNGSDVTGNLKAYLVSPAGAALAATASTAGSGTDAYQLIALTTPYAAKGPATYYIGTQYSSATARYNTHAVGVGGAGKSTGTVYGTFPTTPTMPTTFTANLANIASLF